MHVFRLQSNFSNRLIIMGMCLAILLHCSRGEECKDTFKVEMCKHLAKHGTCDSHFERMKALCRKTCNFCSLASACASVKCPFKHVCTVDANLTPFCKCTVKCTEADKRIGPICARNGKTYKTACLMKQDQCKEKKDIYVYHYGNCIQQDMCADVLPDICANLTSKGLCLLATELMQFYCPISCGLCRQPAPHPQCYFSRFGCCWNSEMNAKGPNQEGCDACREKPFCSHFQSLCSRERNMAVMRQFCPKTCGFC